MSRINRCHAITVAVLLGIAGAPGVAGAQGTPADYARAEGLRAKYEAAAIDVAGHADRASAAPTGSGIARPSRAVISS